MPGATEEPTAAFPCTGGRQKRSVAILMRQARVASYAADTNSLHTVCISKIRYEDGAQSEGGVAHEAHPYRRDRFREAPPSMAPLVHAPRPQALPRSGGTNKRGTGRDGGDCVRRHRHRQPQEFWCFARRRRSYPYFCPPSNSPAPPSAWVTAVPLVHDQSAQTAGISGHR